MRGFMGGAEGAALERNYPFRVPLSIIPGSSPLFSEFVDLFLEIMGTEKREMWTNLPLNLHICFITVSVADFQT